MTIVDVNDSIVANVDDSQIVDAIELLVDVNESQILSFSLTQSYTRKLFTYFQEGSFI